MSNLFNNTFEGDRRFLTAFERLADALQEIARKMPPLTLTAVAQPFVPYQPIQPTIYSSPNVSGTAVQPQVAAFQDLTEGRPMRVGTGG